MTLGLGPAASSLTLVLSIYVFLRSNYGRFSASCRQRHFRLSGLNMSAPCHQERNWLSPASTGEAQEAASQEGEPADSKGTGRSPPHRHRGHIPVSCHSARGPINYRAIKHPLLVDSHRCSCLRPSTRVGESCVSLSLGAAASHQVIETFNFIVAIHPCSLLNHVNGGLKICKLKLVGLLSPS